MALYKQLYRSTTDRVVAGICGGLGVYTGIDPVILRLFMLVVDIATGVVPGVIVYLIAIYIIPLQPPLVVYTDPPNTI